MVSAGLAAVYGASLAGPGAERTGVQVGFWVVTAAVFAMADLGVVLSWFYAVVLLRQSQEEMTRTRLFRFARRFGLKASAAGRARVIARRDGRALTSGSYPAAW